MSISGAEVGSGARAILAAALILASASVCAAAARAKKEATVLQHTVRRGDTLAALSARYYGDRERADLLARVNGIEDHLSLQVGQVLKVPLSSLYRVRPGDTPSGIAEARLGGASRYAVLLEMNGRSARQPLAAGTELEIPIGVEHRLARGETLGKIAQRYYGDAALARWVASYNDIERPQSLQAGIPLGVPLVGALPASRRRADGPTAQAAPAPRVPSSRQAPKASPPASAQAAPARPKPAGEPGPRAAQSTGAPARSASKGAERRAQAGASAGRGASGAADPAVQRGVDLYLRGEYRRAVSVLDAALESEALALADQVRALRYRAYCAVATGDRPAARRSFQALHRRDPGWRPDPVEDSPKIRQVFSESVSSGS